MTRRTTTQFLSLALAALMTIGTLGGVDRLAAREAAQAILAAQAAAVTAQADVPATARRG